MLFFSHLLVVLISTSIFLFFLHKWCRSNSPNPRRRLPPSPPKLPLIGNLHQLGSAPHRSLQSLCRRHGPLMLLHFGKVPVLIASSAEAAREIMKNQDLIFSNRPQLSILGRLFYNNRDVAFAPYGEFWRRIRSICMRASSAEQQKGSVLSRREGGRDFPHGRQDHKGGVGVGADFKEWLTEMGVLMGVVPLWEYIPWLSWIRRFDGLDERVKRVAKDMDEFLEVVIQEHRVREREGGELDFVYILLDFQRENASGQVPIEDDTIKAIILDMFGGGTETTFTALEWTIAQLIRHPATMKTLQD